jgi:hypothetical protein
MFLLSKKQFKKYFENQVITKKQTPNKYHYILSVHSLLNLNI